jgi:putative NADPH-quinone reductase
MPKSVLIVLGHPAQDSLCAALAQAYADGARQAGHAVELLRLADLRFDPVLHEGYKVVQPLEPDLLRAQEAIRRAAHLVFVYPTWWGGMPALMKGFFDRAFLPGYAFKYRAGSPWWDRLLAGRSADVITTMDTPPWFFRLVYGSPGHRQMVRTILHFSGIRPVRLTAIGRVKDTPPAWKAKWIERVRRLGEQA